MMGVRTFFYRRKILHKFFFTALQLTTIHCHCGKCELIPQQGVRMSLFHYCAYCLHHLCIFKAEYSQSGHVCVLLKVK